MKKNYQKAMSILLSAILVESTPLMVNAQTWNNNGYYYERDLSDTKSAKEIEEADIDYQKIINNLTYKDLCCFYLDTGLTTMGEVWYPIAVYTSADRAINQVDAIQNDEFYNLLANSKIKKAYQLVDGKPYIVEDIDSLRDIDKDNLAFALVRNDEEGIEQIVGYINGKDMLAMVLPMIEKDEVPKAFVKVKYTRL